MRVVLPEDPASAPVAGGPASTRAQRTGLIRPPASGKIPIAKATQMGIVTPCATSIPRTIWFSRKSLVMPICSKAFSMPCCPWLRRLNRWSTCPRKWCRRYRCSSTRLWTCAAGINADGSSLWRCRCSGRTASRVACYSTPPRPTSAKSTRTRTTRHWNRCFHSTWSIKTSRKTAPHSIITMPSCICRIPANGSRDWSLCLWNCRSSAPRKFWIKPWRTCGCVS